MNRRNSLTVVASLVTVAALSIAGCGGDDDDEGISKQEFVAQADAICQEADKKQAAIPAKDRPGIYGENFSDAAYLTRHNAVTREALVRLKALDVPEDDRKAVVAVLSALTGSVAAIDKQIAALKAKDPPKQSEANREWQQSYGDVQSSTGALGMTRCQGLGN